MALKNVKAMGIFDGLLITSFVIYICILLANTIFAGVFEWTDVLSLIPQIAYPLIAAILTILSYYFSKKIKITLCLLGVALTTFSLVYLGDFVVWHNQTQAPSNKTITLLSWNTKKWNKGKESNLISEIKKYNADINLIQEVAPLRDTKMIPRIVAAFPDYYLAHFDEYLTLSKFPIIQNNETDWLGHFETLIEYCPQPDQCQNIMLFNVHLNNPFWDMTKDSLSLFAYRQRQFRELTVSLEKNRERHILMAGDFNTLRSYPYIRSLETQLVMNNPRGIFTYPTTFANWFPLIRIDYQFTNKGNTFTNYQLLQSGFSDHYGIFSTLHIQ